MMGTLILNEIYLDNNATTRPLPEVVTAMRKALGAGFGNPSSVHSAGERTRALLRDAREAVAALLGADKEELVFTSGATEANNLVLSSAVRKSTGRARIVTLTVEHSSVLKTCQHLEAQGAEVVHVPVGSDGRVNMEGIESVLDMAPDLVSVQWVNSETGVVQPVEEIGSKCRERGITFHTDAAQAVGKVPMAVGKLPVDFLTFSGHKFHGPQGVGGVYVRQAGDLTPLLFGGDQERGLRPGTENVPGIVGMGKAAALRHKRLDETIEKLTRLRDEFEQAVRSLIPGAKVNGSTQHRVCNTTNLQFPGVDGQAMVIRLDQAGIRCSQSSACTNQRPEPSYVLRAMGLSEKEAYASIRFSVSELNTLDEVRTAAHHIAAVWEKLRAFSCRG